VRERLHGLLRSHGVTLLEAFAEQVAELLIHEFGAHWVRVVVVKPRKFDDVESVGVAIERRREPDPAAGRGSAPLSVIGAGMVPGKP